MLLVFYSFCQVLVHFCLDQEVFCEEDQVVHVVENRQGQVRVVQNEGLAYFLRNCSYFVLNVCQDFD